MDFSELCYIDATGYHFPDYPTTLAWLTAGYQAIYGADVVLTSDSQDGQWLAIQAKAIYDSAAQGASTFNSFSPTTAQGIGLDRVVKINGINRQSPTNSTVDLTVVGQAGTTLGSIANPAQAIDTLSQIWNLPVTTIPSGGTITVTATASLPGSLQAAANTVTGIYTPTLGWQTVNNATPASPGQPVQSDAELRIRQTESTANPSLTVLEGTLGAVLNVTGVTFAQDYENDTDTTDANGLPPHSICIVVSGGADADIASAIQIHKTPGTNTFGDTSVNTTDSHGMPLVISFQRAVPANIGVQITLSTTSSWSTDFETQIALSVADYINSLGIGALPQGAVLLSKLYIPAYVPGTPASGTFDISSIEMKKNAGSFAAANVSIDFDELPLCDPSTEVTFVIT